MKVLCGEGVANHTDPESCAATREGRSEALTGDSVGQPLSGENQLRGADAFRPAEGNTAPVAPDIDELAALVGYIVNNLNGHHIVVTADHGFR